MPPLPPTYLWLIAGVILVLAEALGASGIGLFFAGLGAIVTGAALWLGVIANTAYIEQWLTFFATTGLWVMLLWRPVQRFRHSHHRGHYSNIVGETAYIGSQGLTRQQGGEATWSGTIMKAELDKNAPVERIEAGAPAIVVDVRGATLIVKPK